VPGKGVLLQLTSKDWFPHNTTLCVTPNGSMDQQTISQVVKHINDCARLTVP